MTVDLACLLMLALWSLPLNHIPAIARVRKSGIAWGLSNRETSPPVAAWVGRADRAQRNHHDNLPLIAIVILIAQVIGQTDGVTALASVVVLVMRLIHGLAYLAGQTVPRSAAYFGSILALLVIVGRILT